MYGISTNGQLSFGGKRVKKANLWFIKHFCKVLEQTVPMCNLCKRVVNRNPIYFLLI